MGGRGGTVLALVIGALLAGCGEAAEEEPAEAASKAPAAETEKGYASQYSKEDRELFVNICIDEGDSRAHCECFMNYMIERVPYDEFLGGPEDKISRRAMETMMEAVDTCPS